MTFADKINAMISKSALSAFIDSPRFSDYKIRIIEEVDTPDLEADIIELIKAHTTAEPEQKEVNPGAVTEQKASPEQDKITELNLKTDEIVDDIGAFNKGNAGKLQKMTTEQFGNVQQMASDPFQFLFSNLFKQFAKGAGVAALALIIYSAVKLILDRLMQPGREFDRNFKRIARDEILTFTNERLQQELRQGFKSVIITTLPGLRRSQVQGQISGNFYNPGQIPENRIDPRRAEQPFIRAQGLPGNKKYSKGRY